MATRLAWACLTTGCLVACRAGGARTPNADSGAAAAPTVASSGRQGADGVPDSLATGLAPTDAPAVPPDSVPLERGLTLVSVYKVPDGERENTVVVDDVSPEGVVYSWKYREQRGDGAPVTEDSFSRFVSAADLAGAPRLNGVFQRGAGREETPGYTAMSLSRAVYSRLHERQQTPYTTMGAPDSGSALDVSAQVPYKGTLSSVATEPMAILLDGRRVSIATLHVRGRFAYQARSATLDYWVLADSANALILRSVSSSGKLFQMIRIDRPVRASVETELERDCRAELPGIYFAFASADLQPASDPALAGVATLLARHPDWSLVIEGHTDSIGDNAANSTLSLARAEAVRAALVRRAVTATRLRADGFGATRPRESNTTLEGRARNRRVELVRSCVAAK